MVYVERLKSPRRSRDKFTPLFISAVFSNEDFSIQKITGQGSHPDKKGVIEIGFESDERTQDILVRKIKRLTKVIRIQEVKTEYHKTNNSRSIA